MKSFYVIFTIIPLLFCCRDDLFAQNESNATLKLDSIIWTCYLRDSSEFKDYAKWKFHYDENKNATEACYYIFNTIDEFYRPEFKAIFSYNMYDLPVNGIFYHLYPWDVDWVKSSQFQFTYDSTGLLIQKKMNTWQEDLEFWYDDYRYNYAYDSSANLTLITSYYCGERINGTATYWKAYGKNNFSYDSNGNIIQNDIYARWGDDTLNPWLLEDRKLYFYNTSGYSVLHTDYIYNLFTPYREDKYKLNYFFDTSGNLSSFLKCRWDDLDNKWKFILRKNFIYDTIYEGQLIVPTNNILEENLSINDFDFEIFTKKINEMNCDLYLDEQWIADYKGVFYYSGISQTNSELLDWPGMEMYPNPTKDLIYVKWNTSVLSLQVIIYDMWGRAVLNREVEHGEGINLCTLSEGMYIFKFLSKNRIVFSKKVFVL